jgi:hypothetical protein
VVAEKMASIDSGRWTVDDVLETQVDELSTAVSVGSGTERPLGSKEKDKWEKLRKGYEAYLSRTRMEASRRSAKLYFNETTGGSASDDLLEQWLRFLEDAGEI